MGDWPLYDGGPIETAGVNAASSRGITVTASATANTKGSWTELIASTARPTYGLLVNLRSATPARDYLVDVGIGASGSEVVAIPNLVVGGGTGTLARCAPFFFPIYVPAGTRLSARNQASTGSSLCRVQVICLAGGWLPTPGQGRVTDYGTNTADSGAVSIDPGGTAHTKGSWTQITASTTNPIRMLMLGLGNQLNGARSSGDWLLDIGVGGSGSETVIIPDVHVECSTTDDMINPASIGPFPMSIPAGTRIAARSQSSLTTSPASTFDLAVYGVG